VPAALSAQVLDTVESLSRDGRAGEARAALAGWWQDEADGASRLDRQRALWLRATLTLDPDSAVRDYRRLTVEYPGGPYSDRALLRIAQASEERGAIAEAARARETLVRDHPGSSLAQAAREWLAIHREPTSLEPVPDTAESARRATPIPPAPSVLPPERAAGSPSGDFAVQLGAFSTEGRARALVETARSRGLEPRLVRVPGSDLVRVRVGRFLDGGEALDLRERLRGMGMEAIIVQDASREAPPR
jgi:cell division septation protein DedD